MQNKEIKLIVQILGLLAVIFCLIALLTPWVSSYSVSFFTFGYFSNFDSSPFFIKFFETGLGELIFVGIAMIIIFIITLITLIMGVISIKQIDNNLFSRFLMLGMLEIITIILYVIAISVASNNLPTSDAYGIGFIMAIISSIMFFITYSIPKAMTSVSSASNYQQQPMYQHQYQPYQQSPSSQYYQHSVQPQTQQPSTGVKFCSQCGSQISKNTKFCSNCGTKI